MASTYKDLTGVNISSGVKAKLQKWIGRASAKATEKRLEDREAYVAEKKSSQDALHRFNSSNSISSSLPNQAVHVRTRSAPIPMPEAEQVITKRRKASATTPPSYSLLENNESERESKTINSEPKNGSPRELISLSERQHESSSTHSSPYEKQNATNSSHRNIATRTQSLSALEDTTEDAMEYSSSLKKLRSNDCNVEEVMNSSAVKKVNKSTRDRSYDNSEDSGNSDNEKNGPRSSSPNSVQKLSGQIQTRLQKLVEKPSSIGSKRTRASSEESMSSTDDSLNAPNSPYSTRQGTDGKKRNAKELRELELALKELVENVGARGGKATAKDSTSNTPDSGRRKALSPQQNPLKSELARQEERKSSKEDKANFSYGDLEKSQLRESRNSSSSSESDTGVFDTGKATVIQCHAVPNNEVVDQIEGSKLNDTGECIFMTDIKPSRELNGNSGPHIKRPVVLQEVLICETLIEESPRQNSDDRAENAQFSDRMKNNKVQAVPSKKVEEYFPEPLGNKNHPAKTEPSSKGYNEKVGLEKGSHAKLRAENPRKLERPGLRKRYTAPDSSSLKVYPSSTVRESMRQYLNFKDADLSAFAVECVRHANRKKLNHCDEHQNSTDKGNKMETDETYNTLNSTHSQHQKPFIIISSQGDHKGERLSETVKNGTRTALSPDELKETAKQVIEKASQMHHVFARTAEEAECFEKGLPPSLDGKHIMDNEPLERFTNIQAQHVMGSQRLYKFPSLPMFYTPQGDEETETKKESKMARSQQRKSVAITSFPASFPDSTNPFCYGADSTTSLSKDEAKSRSALELDKTENSSVTGRRRAFGRTRKFSVPTRPERYSSSSSVRVNIEALI